MFFFVLRTVVKHRGYIFWNVQNVVFKPPERTTRVTSWTFALINGVFERKSKCENFPFLRCKKVSAPRAKMFLAPASSTQQNAPQKNRFPSSDLRIDKKAFFSIFYFFFSISPPPLRLEKKKNSSSCKKCPPPLPL